MRTEFKKGDLVTGNGSGTYSVTTKDFIGVVNSISGSIMDVLVLKVPTGCSQGNEGATFGVDTRCFKKYTGPDPRVKEEKVAGKSTTVSKQPQAFMQGIDVRLIRTTDYYDVNTEDYAGEVGNIHSYLKYDTLEGCWIVYLKMSDGEFLEVLESELVGYSSVSGKSKSVKKESIEPLVKDASDRIKLEPLPHEPMPIKAWGPKKEVGWPALPTKAHLDTPVKAFDLTPKKKSKPRLVF